MNTQKLLSVFLVLVLAGGILFSVSASATIYLPENGNTVINTPNPDQFTSPQGVVQPYATPVPIYEPTTTSSPSGNGAILIGGPLDGASASGSYIYTTDNSLPVITKDPYSETKEAGESTSFIVHADNYTSVIWYAIDPVSYQRYYAYNIGNYVEGVTCTGTESERLAFPG